MKQITIVLIILAVSAGAFAQSQFSVSGSGRVFYEPDAYDLSFGVVTDNPDIQKCKEAHLLALDKVKEFVEKHKDQTLSLKQEATRLETIYRNDQKERFRFTTSYVARVKDVKSLPPLQEGLISAGVTDIYGLDMFSAKLPRFIEQARKEAIKDAKSKAALAAADLDWTLMGATGISFQEADRYADKTASANFGSRTYAYDAANRPDMTTSFACQVTITFSFMQKK